MMKILSPLILSLSLAAGCLFLPACGHGETPDPSAMSVTVSIPPQAYLVERIAGSDVKIVTLVQGGESPATYQPTDLQVSDVMRSSVYFCLGVPFEQGRWLDAIQSSGRGMKMVDCREGMTLRRFATAGEGAQTHEHGSACTHCASHDPSGHDPHVWLSPEHLKIMARTMTRTLGELRPDRAPTYQAHLATLETELDLLHEEIMNRLGGCKGKCIFLYHPAWGYFCDTYGLKQMAIEVEGKEPSDEELTRIQVLMREDCAKTIFVQPQIAGRAVEPVARAVGAEVKILDPLARDILKNLRDAADTIWESFQ